MLSPESFIVQHWCSHHRSETSQPKFKFKIENSCRDALSRQIGEAVLIEESGTLNSKAEFGMNHICRMVVEDNPWKSEEEIKNLEQAKKKNKQDLHEFIVEMKSVNFNSNASSRGKNETDENLCYRFNNKKTERTRQPQLLL